MLHLNSDDFDREKKRENPIFEITNDGYALTTGTKVVLLRGIRRR